MKITVEDHAPGAGAGRQAYLEGRTRRVREPDDDIGFARQSDDGTADGPNAWS